MEKSDEIMNMKLSNSIMDLYLDIVKSEIFKPNPFFQKMYKLDFILAVEKYNKLSKNIFNIFKRNRLEKEIVFLSKYVIDDVKKENKSGNKINFQRFSKLDIKK